MTFTANPARIELVRTRSPMLAAALALASTAALVGCGGASAPATSPTDHGSHGSGEPEVDAYLALCDMRDLIAAGDLERAEATFHDEVHEALHELAEELETTDREASAALLVAKAKVEADLEREPVEPAALGEDTRTLQRAMAEALGAAGIDPPSCRAEAA
ncbi:hypothetical protein HRbin12_00438 [bacterium HR12]|nr:hypothetical protein HRbin12_00438 [bacterium HR12]